MLARELKAGRGRRASQDGLEAPLSISLDALLVDGSDHEFRRLIYRMIITQSRLVEIRKQIARQVSVSGAQYTLLMAILRLEGDAGVSISKLADYLEVTGPHVTGEVQQLAAAGLVRKTANPRDMRGVQVRLSAVGRRRLLAAFDYIRNINDILFSGISSEEFRALTRFNRKFMTNTSLALEWTQKSSDHRMRRRSIRSNTGGL